MPTRARFAGLLAVVAAAALAVVATAPPAAAHAELVSSTPAEGGTVQQLPPRVTLTFSEPVRTPAFVEVTGPSGEDVGTGQARIRDAEVMQPVGGSADPGRYAMSYRVTSADGHPISGTVRFTLAGPANAPETTPEQEGAATPAPETPEASEAPQATPSPEQTQPTPAEESEPAAAPAGDSGGGMGTGTLVLLLAALAVGLAALGIGTRRALRHSVSMVDDSKSGRPRGS